MTKVLYNPVFLVLIGIGVAFLIRCTGDEDSKAERLQGGLYAEENVRIRLRYTMSNQVNETTILYDSPDSWSRESSLPLATVPDVIVIGEQAWEFANGKWEVLDDPRGIREEFAALFDDYNRLAKALESSPGVQEGQELGGEPTVVKVGQGEFSPFEGQDQQEARVVVGEQTGRIDSIEVAYALPSAVSALSVSFEYSQRVSIENPE